MTYQPDLVFSQYVYGETISLLAADENVTGIGQIYLQKTQHKLHEVSILLLPHSILCRYHQHRKQSSKVWCDLIYDPFISSVKLDHCRNNKCSLIACLLNFDNDIPFSSRERVNLYAFLETEIETDMDKQK